MKKRKNVAGTNDECLNAQLKKQREPLSASSFVIHKPDHSAKSPHVRFFFLFHEGVLWKVQTIISLRQGETLLPLLTYHPRFLSKEKADHYWKVYRSHGSLKEEEIKVWNNVTKQPRLTMVMSEEVCFQNKIKKKTRRDEPTHIPD